MRTKRRLQVVRGAFIGAVERGFRVTDWSLQRDHIHLIVEPQSKEKLAAGVKGLCVRIARGLNRLAGRRGSVFADRYHARALETPREVRSALAYVLNNARRHRQPVGSGGLDLYSSALYFDGFREHLLGRWVGTPKGPAPVAKPRTWLRAVGWRRHGLIRLDEVPAARNATGRPD